MMIVTDHSRVDIAEAVYLSGAQKADINPTTLQPVTENLAGGDNRVSRFGQLTVANRQRQHIRLGANRARLVNQHHIR